MKNNRDKKAGISRWFINFLLAVTGFLFLASLSVVITLNLRGLYYSEIEGQNLEELTGLPEDVIRAEYDTLIDYNLILQDVEELEFSVFPMSEQGRIHFEEVKRIFTVIQYSCIVTGFLFLAGLFFRIRKREYGCLNMLSVLTVSVPAILGVMVVGFWRTFFVLFHQLFFNNDYWIFDERTDPVILILPDSFFARCAVVILLLIFAGGIVSGIAGIWLTRREGKRARKMRRARKNSTGRYL